MRASVWQQNDDSTSKMERPTSQVRPPGRRERPKLDAFVHFCCPRTEPTRWHVRHSDEAILSWENTRVKSKSHINVDIKSNFKHEIRTMGGLDPGTWGCERNVFAIRLLTKFLVLAHPPRFYWHGPQNGDGRPASSLDTFAQKLKGTGDRRRQQIPRDPAQALK